MTTVPLGEPIPAILVVLQHKQNIPGYCYFGLGDDWSFAPDDEGVPLDHLHGDFAVTINFTEESGIAPIEALAKLEWNHGSYDFVAATDR